MKPRFHNQAQNNSEKGYCILPARLFSLCRKSAHIHDITVCFEAQHREGEMIGRFLLKEHVAPIFPPSNIFYSIEF